MSTSTQDARQDSPNATTELDAVVVGAGFSGMYMLHSLRDKLGMKRARVRGRQRRRRHLVLEPLSGRALRLGQLHLLLHVRQAPAAGMGVVRALSRAGRDPALPRALRRALRPEARHRVRHARHRRHVYDEKTNHWTVRTDKGDVVNGAATSSPPSAACRRPTCRSSRASIVQGQGRTTPASGRTTASISPASGSASSAPAPPRCRRFPKSLSRPST